MTQKEAIAKSPSGRVRRTTLKPKGKMYVSEKEPGYEYRFVNDVDGKVEQKIEDGWEVVNRSQTKQVGDRTVDKPSAEGSLHSIHIGRGYKGVLMRIKKEWYDEDQAAKQAVVDQTEAATKAEALDGHYGKITIERK